MGQQHSLKAATTAASASFHCSFSFPSLFLSASVARFAKFAATKKRERKLRRIKQHQPFSPSLPHTCTTALGTNRFRSEGGGGTCLTHSQFPERHLPSSRKVIRLNFEEENPLQKLIWKRRESLEGGDRVSLRIFFARGRKILLLASLPPSSFRCFSFPRSPSFCAILKRKQQSQSRGDDETRRGKKNIVILEVPFFFLFLDRKKRRR